MNKDKFRISFLTIQKSIFLLLILVSLSSFSQNKSCTIYFKDNTTLIGLGRLKLDGTVKFRLNEDSKSEFYDAGIIDKIEMEQEIYQYKKIKENSPIWMKVIIKGKVNLYTNDVGGYTYMGGTGMGGNGMGGVGMSYGGGSVTYYYVSHEGDEKVFQITAIGTISKNFKNAASEFFKDCPVLVEKIQNKTFKKGDLEEVVKFYNSQCNNTETPPTAITK